MLIEHLIMIIIFFRYNLQNASNLFLQETRPAQTSIGFSMWSHFALIYV